MDEIKDLFSKFSSAMDNNSRGVQIGCYSVALIGLSVAMRRVRPFSQFRKASDIPNRFIKERRELTGTVERIDPNGALLLVQHKPLVALFSSRGNGLPVKVSGINVSGLGISWLQAIVAGNQVKFVPIVKDKNFVQCEITMEQETFDKKLRTINVGESLVSIGFGSLVDVEETLSTDPKYHAYYNKLKRAEAYALRKKMGIKYYVKPTKLVLFKIGKQLNNLISKTAKKVPKVAVT